MSEHTPTPWQIEYDEKGRAASIGHEHILIASLSGSNPVCNARLIAAAPDLLAALQELSQWCDTNINGVPTDLAEIQDRADTAIAKAEGK